MDNKKTGFLLINKPSGPTSHDIIYKMRRITGIKKIGHAGTLDPFASGLLVVAVGRESTKQISKYVKLDKEYIATLKLGSTSSTYDPEGEIVDNKFLNNIKIEDINKVLASFIGEQKQIPPMFSAKKVKGERLYKLARKGIEIKREAVGINIIDISLVDFSWPILKIKVKCSSGTYIRSLAHDIGQTLGCGAYLEELKRTEVGDFKLEKAVNLQDINKNNWNEFIFL